MNWPAKEAACLPDRPRPVRSAGPGRGRGPVTHQSTVTGCPAAPRSSRSPGEPGPALRNAASTAVWAKPPRRQGPAHCRVGVQEHRSSWSRPSAQGCSWTGTAPSAGPRPSSPGREDGRHAARQRHGCELRPADLRLGQVQVRGQHGNVALPGVMAGPSPRVVCSSASSSLRPRWRTGLVGRCPPRPTEALPREYLRAGDDRMPDSHGAGSLRARAVIDSLTTAACAGTATSSRPQDAVNGDSPTAMLCLKITCPQLMRRRSPTIWSV